MKDTFLVDMTPATITTAYSILGHAPGWRCARPQCQEKAVTRENVDSAGVVQWQNTSFPSSPQTRPGRLPKRCGRWSVSGGGTGGAEPLHDASRNLIGMEGGDSLPLDSLVAGHLDHRESLVEDEDLNCRDLHGDSLGRSFTRPPRRAGEQPTFDTNDTRSI